MPLNSMEFDQNRLQHLKKNILEAQELIEGYKQDLSLELDRTRKKVIYLRIVDLKETVGQWRQEYREIEAKVAFSLSPQLADAGVQLQRLESKVDDVLTRQAATQTSVQDLRVTLIASLNVTEQSIIKVVTERLAEEQLEVTQAILDKIKASQIPEQELQEALNAVQHVLIEAHQQGKTIAHLSSEDTERLYKIAEEPTLDMSHKLAVTIPIIPFILSYQGELGLQNGLNLKAIWSRLVMRVRRPA